MIRRFQQKCYKEWLLQVRIGTKHNLLTTTSVFSLCDSIIEGKRPSSKDNSQLDKQFLLAWDNFRLKDGILYKKATINGEDVEQLVLPTTLIDTILQAYPNDLGHQGRDRTTSLIQRHFLWPGMMDDINQTVRLCDRCVRT